MSAIAGEQIAVGTVGYRMTQSNQGVPLAPTVNDDVTQGYATGSGWVDTDKVPYMNRNPNAGAAIWDELITAAATQTLTGKTLTTPTLTLKQSATPTPTAEGDIQWDTDDSRIAVGDGAGTKLFSDDAVVQARANHTGTQTMSTISDAGALATKSTIATADIDANAVTYAKMQNVAADERLLGNIAGASQPIAELTVAQVRAMLGISQEPIWPSYAFPGAGAGSQLQLTGLSTTTNANLLIGLGHSDQVAAGESWYLLFDLPDVLPVGLSAKLRLEGIADAVTGVAKIDVKWNRVASGGSYDVALTSEGVQTFTWSAGDSFKGKEIDLLLDAFTPAGGDRIMMALTFTASGWTLAAKSVWRPRIIFA